jgi:hypothetical protein
MKKATAKSGGVAPAQFKKIALSFAEAHEKPSYGSPAIFVAKKFFTRLRKEDNSVVLIVHDMEHRNMMLELDPETYHITPHYKDYPAVLVRVERISPEELKVMLERRWRQIARKRLIREVDEKVMAAGSRSRPRSAPRSTKRKPRA